MKFALALFLALSSAAQAQTARYEDRLPLQSGLWSDRSRVGEGFEIRAVRDEAYIIWFTFDRNNSPVWYVAQGKLGRLGDSTFLLKKTRYVNSTVSFTDVGTLTLTVRNPEQISVRILSADIGTVSRRPQLLRASANYAEVDHSGQWFEPLKSGYGIGLNENENTGFVTTYLYDDAGEPIWFFGGRTGKKNQPYPLTKVSAACPTCTYSGATYSSVGTLTVQFPSLDQLSVTLEGNGIPAQFKRPDAKLSRLTAPPHVLRANQRLVALSNVDSLKRELIAGIVNPFLDYGRVATFFSASPPTPSAPPTYSNANTQLDNVDEAITLRTDGERVYAMDLSNSLLRIARYQEPGIVSEREVALSVPLLVRPNGVASRFNLNSPSSGLVRFRNKTVVMRSNAATFNTFISPPPPDSWISGRTVVEIVFDNAAEALQTYQLEGYLLSARRVGNRLYLLSRSSVFPAAGQYTDVSEYTARLQALPIADFLPAQWINGVKTPALDAARVFLPPSGAAPSRPEFSMITEIDLSKNMTDPGAIVTTAVLGQVSATFVSEKSLYLATNRYFPGRLITDFVPDFQATDVHRFSLTPTGVNYEASGSVLGNIEGSAEQVGLRFSEKGNDIRIVTTSSESNVINRVSVLAPSTSAPDLLSTVSILPSEQSPASIGKPGERITTSRFIGDRLYVSTFLRTDPLYVIDMANSANPKILSALEVPGFSDYLYPLSSRYLLGFGYNATSNGVRLGIELNVFDVGDPQRISRVINMPLGDNSSRSALSLNPLAFSYLPIDANSSRFGLPVVSSQSSGWMDFNFDDRGPNLRSQLKVDTSSSPTGGSAAGSTARGLYLRGLIVYLENGNIWYTLPDGTARKL